MTPSEFVTARSVLGKTQKVMARLLGVSLKAVHSYEQGWRNIPAHVERQVFFLLARRPGQSNEHPPCWEQTDCPREIRDCCPAWEYDAGNLCWFACGTVCQGRVKQSWKDKMQICKSCAVFQSILE